MSQNRLNSGTSLTVGDSITRELTLQARRQARHNAWLQSADYAWQQIPPQLDGHPPQLTD